MDAVEGEAQRELEATLAARAELGPGHDEALVQGFVDRIEREIDRRIDERLAARGPRKRSPSPLHPGNLGVCIPIVVLAGALGGTVGVVVSLCALALVFLVAEFRR
jgi:hypothetical protein